jgi:hypothetical protein
MRTRRQYELSHGLFAAALPAVWGQAGGMQRGVQWWAMGSMIFFFAVLALLIYLTAKTSMVRRSTRR